MEFNKYTTDDFLLDDSFVAYRRGSDPAAIAFWTNWQRSHPPNLSAFQEAEQIYDMLNGQKPDMEQSLAELKGLISDREKSPSVDWSPKRSVFRSRAGVPRTRLSRTWWLLAASLVLVSGFLGYYMWKSQPIIYQTAYGEQKAVELPDGSRITLNSHSRVEYRQTWNQDREVKLDGEAFFAVQHLSTNAPFRIATNGPFRVEVVGTEFTMTSRANRKRVVLNQGKVRVSGNSGGQTLTLAPGQMAELDSVSGMISRRNVQPDRYDAWLRHQLVFDNVTLTEAIQLIEDQFGMKIQVKSPADQDRRFVGILPLKDPENVLNIVARYNGLRVERAGVTYVLTR
ncbi:hypothetical protein GCM10027347_58040 [Larkinella harenae]